MRKTILLSLLLSICAIVNGQHGFFFGLNQSFSGAPPVEYPFFSHGGTTKNYTAPLADDYQYYNCENLQLLYFWSDVEATEGNYDFSRIGEDLITADEHGVKYVGMEIEAGADAPFDWLVPLGVGTFYTNSPVEPGAYPDYYNQTYIDKYYSLYENLFAYLSTLDLNNIVLYIKVVWSSTGDTAPYKGSCISDCFGIADNQTWSEYLHTTYNFVHHLLDLSGLDIHLAMNAGNDAKELNWLVDSYPDDFVKKGDLGHDYFFNFENLHPKIGYVSQSEIQGYILASSHYKQEILPLMCSSLSCGLKIPCITIGWTNIIQNKEVLDFFDEMVTQAIPETATKGFIYLAQKISFDYTDTGWLSENAYGNVIGNTSAYNYAVSLINSNPDYGQAYKDFLLENAQKTYINTTRVSNVIAGANPNASYNLSDPYLMDFGYGLSTNYSINITQNNIHSTSRGVYRVTQIPDTSIYGRYGAECILNAGVGSMSFDVNNQWGNSATTASVSFDIVYYDSGTGSWSLQADTGSGMGNVATQTNTNTSKWLHKTVTVDGMKLNSSEDFKLNYISGTNTKFCFIKIAGVFP